MKTGCVLLADSHLNMLQGVHSLLEALFETVVMVADEPSLIDALTRVKPDLVIVDLSLPVAERGNILGRVRDRYPAAAMVIVSVHDDPAVVSDLLEAGVAGVVLKHALATDLLPAIRDVLGGNRYVSPALQRRFRAAGIEPKMSNQNH
jgi:DNA-binding NarL/FixJ family response regulator